MTRLLEAAINGRRTRAEHPGVPLTPEQQARAAAASVAAGAGAIHVHVRAPDGAESLAARDVARALTTIRAASPTIPISVSTGAWIVPAPAARLDAVRGWTLLPDIASVNFHEHGARELAELLRSRGVGVEAGMAGPYAAQRLLDSDLAERCLRLMFEPADEDADSALRTVAQLEAVLDRAGVKLPRLLHGTGGAVWRLLDEAVARGYETRIGLEDTLTLPDGALAADNAALVAEARRRGA